MAGAREALGAVTPAERVRALLAAAIKQRLVPGAVALVSRRDEVVFHETAGWAALEPERRAMTIDTVFDLASLTKPLACAAIALALVDRGLLSLDDHISEHLPELASLRAHGVTIRRILAHCSGLPSWRPLYVEEERGVSSADGLTGEARQRRPPRTESRDLRNAVARVGTAGLAYEPGTRVEYSCVGYACLGVALERITGCRLDVLFETLVARPLELEHTRYGPVGDDTPVAASERDNTFERALVQRAGLSFTGWRQGVIQGEVHDGNAYYALGGVSGNAGLFGSAEDVARLGGMWLGGGEWRGRRVLSAAAVRLALSTQTGPLGQRRGLGWVLSQPQGPALRELVRPPSSQAFFPDEEHPWVPRSCGEYVSDAAFGHSGFTGASLWVEPTSETIAVLLTNATHPALPGGTGLARLRARFHNVVFSSDWTT